MKILCYDCFSGISGDMNLAALVDLGVPVKYLKEELSRLHLDGYQIKVSREKRKGIEGTMVDVILKDDPGNLIIHGKNNHTGDRSWRDIREMIDKSTLKAEVKKISLAIFQKIAVAEAKIHGVEEDNVHFHEVGAIDSIVDIVGAAICLDYLKPDQIVSTPPQLGGGFVKCQHGLIPVPAPATQEILFGLPARTGLVEAETTTPTGAAILATIVNKFESHLKITFGKTGYGIGHRDFEIPNVLRVFWAEQEDKLVDEQLVIECNIDDMNPEWYEYIMEQLYVAGAEDVYLTPIIMKKSRPGITLSVLCKSRIEKEISNILFLETSSLGLRKTTVIKDCLDREILELKTSLGTIKVKIARRDHEMIRWKAEYEDCKKIALAKNIPLREVYVQVEKAMAAKIRFHE